MLSEKLVKINEEIVKANNAIDAKDFEGIKTAKTEAEKLISEYNDENKKLLFDGFLSTENAFLEALKEPFYEEKTLKTKVDSKTEKESVELGTKECLVNLNELEEYSSTKQLCVDGQWKYKLEKLCKLMAKRIMKDVEAKCEGFEKLYKISADGNKVELPNPTSNAQTTKAIQSIVDGIIFEDNKGVNTYKVIAKDVKYIEYLMSTSGKKGAIKAPSASTMLKLITKMLHRIVTNGSYEVEFEGSKK